MCCIIDTTRLHPKRPLSTNFRHGSILGGSLKRSPLGIPYGAWGRQSSKRGATIPKSFGFEAATRYGATNQCYPESDLFEPCPIFKNLSFCKYCYISSLIKISKMVNIFNVHCSNFILQVCSSSLCRPSFEIVSPPRSF